MAAGYRAFMTSWRWLLLAGAVGGTPAAALAQATNPPAPPPPARQTVPDAQRPPKGMCRIWMPNVPASRQPAPTDCASAVRNRPPDARVIFPDDRASRAKATTTAPPARTSPPVRRDTTRPPRRPPADPPPA
jgi:hypothetical protein